MPRGKGAKKRAKARYNKGKRPGGSPPRFALVLRLKGIETSVDSFADLIQAFNFGKLEKDKFKTLCYGLSIYSQFLRMAENKEIEERLNELEGEIRKRFGA